ncbi:MAG: tRNA (adenosine(37)-N6)-dimethylallyltransferase MiaA, partial [Deltaproteobacteria bacterium]|nr:tRNA (adenosine(37)-N6)-dimethylallyltransferase MiaA [Deltaproteobacteria bacterium]
MELKKNDKPRIIIILGPTASGKTAAALSLAQQYPIEIINADSMQVYRYMDIGTAKPSPDECACAPHHLFSIINPDQYYSAALFVEQGRQLIEDIVARGRLPVFVGGTGLYIRAVTGGLFEGPEGDEKIRTELRQKPAEERYLELVRVDPQSAVRINLHDTVRVVRALEVYYLTGKTLTEHHREHAFRDVPYCSLQIGLAHERHELHRSIEKRV